MHSKLVSTLILAAAVLGQHVYDPNSSDNWTDLVPEEELPEGSYNSVPFSFGIVVNPFVVNDEGAYEAPEFTTIQRELTTTYVTSVVTAAPKATKAANVNQIADGQIQKTATTLSTVTTESEEDEEDEDEEVVERREDYDETQFLSPVYTVSCKKNDTLEITLQDGILRDANDRIGCIVGNHQFQFDGPVPQYGTIYAAGWSITAQGQLALGNNTKFYQCSSGKFFNLYDQKIGDQCNPVTLDAVELVDC